MISPALAVFSVVITFVISFGLFLYSPLDVDNYFYVSILILIGIYTGFAIFNDKTTYQKRRWLQDPFKIIGKYIFWGAIIYVPYNLYADHPFYSQHFPNTEAFFDFYMVLYLWAGLPYFILAEKLRYCPDNYLNDPYIRILALARALLKGKWVRLRRLYRNRRYRTFLVSSGIRFHFSPLMVNQIFFTHREIVTAVSDGIDWEFGVVTAIMTSLVWSIDANNASIGYFWESNFTKTRFKEMDPYPLHWIITLACYMPFTMWATTFLPALMDHNTAATLLIDSTWFDGLTTIIGLVFLAGYVYAGSSLYFSTSNMTYKAIQTRGLYALVRHPATLCKVGFFGITTFKFAMAYTAINIFAYVLWTGIYVARTLCEERFLDKFEEYRVYKAKTRYRIIPGIF